jgi:tetratricopeptide (TPR) repeat protein
MWDEGRLAARSGNHERAVTCLVREAEARTAEGSHGRAAIAFRTAAEQARLQGLVEQGEQLLGRAAAAYTHAAARNELTPDTAQQAWISAAKCFLQLQQLDRAASCIEEARRVVADTNPHLDHVRTAT